MAGPSGILVVDDSALSREALRRLLSADPHLRVVGEATTGEEAIDLVKKLKPQLVTMDLNMPGMGGLKAIEAIMADRPTPIVVISERSSTTGTDWNYEALSRGALELVPKSAVFGVGAADVRRFVERIRLLAQRTEADERPFTAPPAAPAPAAAEPPALLGIGASTGGPKALVRLLKGLGPSFPLPIAVVQHMAEDFFDSFVRFLGDASGLPTVSAQNGMKLLPGRVHVGVPKSELMVRENLTARLSPSPATALISPTVDSLFFSMATAFKGRGMGVLLTGMGEDGAQGLLRMRRVGARTAVQDRASCAVFGMPRAAVELGAAETVLPLDQLAGHVTSCLASPAAKPSPPKPSNKRRVLLVDEDERGGLSARSALEDAGYEVLTLSNPMMLAGYLRRTPVDLVLLEPDLTVMKGEVLLQSLRSASLGHVPVFLHGKSSLTALKPRAVAGGAVGCVSKMADSATLVREVNAFLGGPTRPPR